MSQKRKYTKRSDYWSKFDMAKEPLENLSNPQGPLDIVATAGEAYYDQVSKAYNRMGKGGSSGTSSRVNRAASARVDNKYANINEGILPWAYQGSSINVRESILLCQKAYANIPIFRNTIDIMAEFANTDIYLEGGTEKSREFIYKWFEKIQMWTLKDQYFREYYRSGNVFLYRIDGKFSAEDYAKMSTVYGGRVPQLPIKVITKMGLKKGHIPLKYVMLNPYDVSATRALSFSYGRYEKILSEYELEALKNPKTEHDKAIFDGLPEYARSRIKQGSWTQDGLSISLDPSKLIYSFYKKQDYEPFAIPFGWPVLDDINWKIELKKMDQAITRTVENVILLITMGNEPDKGGINPQNFGAMQTLFQNESVGRVLISDYTTKANFVIPDINKVLGPEKYAIVNNDIREGLQNIVVGEEKFSNKQIKAEIFFERLREARSAFLSDVLKPQIKMICKAMGFRKFPEAKFTDKDIKDEVQFQRVTTRLLELGILTPQQGIEAMTTGILPRSVDLDKEQEGYATSREKGFYNPLVGGVPPVEAPGMEEERDLKEKIAEENVLDRNTGPIPSGSPPSIKSTPKSPGRPNGATAVEGLYGASDIKAVVKASENLREFVTKKIKSQHSVKRLSKQKKELIDKLCENILVSKDRENWEESAIACVEDINKIGSLDLKPEIAEIAAEHDLGFYPASLLYHSKNIKTEEE